MGRSGKATAGSFFDALVATGIAELTQSCSIEELRARQVMNAVAESLCGQYARTSMYVPAMLESKRLQRDEVIAQGYGQDGPPPAGAKRFTQDRVKELAAEYELTERQVYSIIKFMRERRIAAKGAKPRRGTA